MGDPTLRDYRCFLAGVTVAVLTMLSEGLTLRRWLLRLGLLLIWWLLSELVAWLWRHVEVRWRS